MNMIYMHSETWCMYCKENGQGEVVPQFSQNEGLGISSVVARKFLGFWYDNSMNIYD